jgi:hypothetical protein
MTRKAEAAERVVRQLTEDQVDVRQLYLRSFPGLVERFAAGIGEAVEAWEMWRDSGQSSERVHFCQTLFLSVISFQVSSMHLFLSGHMAASGNVQRQVLESIALTYLCANVKLRTYEDFVAERYSSSKASRDLQRYGRAMFVEPAALVFLNEMTKHYSNYSHPSMLNLKAMHQGDRRAVYIGANFDGQNLKIYELEAKWREGLASKLKNILQGVKYVLHP